MGLKIFIVALIFAIGLVAYRSLEKQKEIHNSIIDSASNPFRPRIFVATYGDDTKSIAYHIVDLLKKSSSPFLLTIGITQQIFDDKTSGNVVNELKLMGYDRFLPNIRISLLKNTSNEYESYFNCINNLYTDEPYCAFISHDTVMSKGWDRQSISLFENTDSQSRRLLLTAFPQNDFTVCAGSFHGIPHFESRKLAFDHEDLAVPLTSLWTSYMFTLSNVAKYMFVHDMTIPHWASASVLSSKAHEFECLMVSLQSFKISQSSKIETKKEKFSVSTLTNLISEDYLEFLGWDFSTREPTGRARLGLLPDASSLEKRLKWGDANNQHHVNNLATGTV